MQLACVLYTHRIAEFIVFLLRDNGIFEFEIARKQEN
jgi:hypothetical protein